MDDFEALAASGLLDDARIVRTQRADDTPEAADLLTKDVAGVVRHDLIPFVSYPYEWTFSMLKDAALLQLDLLLGALEHGLILKDSTPYNVQFNGARAVFIDLGSFERRRVDEVWVGYRQFCMLYLYPLLLQASKDVNFQPWLRGSVDGIAPTQMRGVASLRDRFRRGFTTHVFLHARLERRYADRGAEVRRAARRVGVSTQMVVANVRKMRKLVNKLAWTPPQGVWTTYGERNTYTEDDARRKDTFVRDVTLSERWGLVWDIGCNNGRHSRIAAEGARHVIAIDADPGPVELLYRELPALVEPTEAARSAALTHRAIDYIERDPLDVARAAAWNTARLAELDPVVAASSRARWTRHDSPWRAHWASPVWPSSQPRVSSRRVRAPRRRSSGSCRA